MAQMERNVNLEEIDTDSLFGIPFLSFQSLGQKVLLASCLAFSIILMVVGTVILDFNSYVILGICFIPLIVGVLFGCNYNEDFSLFRYLKLILINPVKKYRSMPSEDLDQIRKKKTAVEKAEKEMLSDKDILTSDYRKKTRTILVICFCSFTLILIILFFVLSSVKDNNVHHVVSMINSVGVL